MLKYNSSVCTGCRICEQACNLAHYQGDETDGSSIKIMSNWPKEESAVFCRHCHSPRCIPACPSEALTQNDGVIRLDRDKCSQCYECFNACPFKARVIDQQGYPRFCDRCSGSSYECVAFCPAGALKRGEK